MTFFLVYIYSLVRGNFFVLACLTLCPIIILLFQLTGAKPDLPHILITYFIILSVPLSGMITSHLLEKNLGDLKNKQFISRAAFIVTIALSVQSLKFVDFLFAALKSLEIHSAAQIVTVVVSTCNACLKSAAIAAFGVLFLVNMVEIPFVWFCQAFGFTKKARVEFAGLRPALSFVVVVYSFDLIVGLFSRRMWPDVFLK